MLFWEAVGSKKTGRASRVPVIQPITTRQRSIQNPTRCDGVTRIGRRCRCRRAPGSQFCSFHDPVISARIREKAAAKREARKRQLKALPEGYLKTITTPDGIARSLENLFREVRLGIVPPRTAQIMLGIIDRMLAYDRLVSTVGPRRASKKLRAREVRRQVAELLQEMQIEGQPKPLATKPSTRQAESVKPAPTRPLPVAGATSV